MEISKLLMRQVSRDEVLQNLHAISHDKVDNECLEYVLETIKENLDDWIDESDPEIFSTATGSEQ